MRLPTIPYKEQYLIKYLFVVKIIHLNIQACFHFMIL
jgi:hypothetical protein